MQNDNLVSRLQQKKIIVATHVYGTGASQDLFRYLVEHKARRVLFIGHPLFYEPNLKGSGYVIYDRGKKIYERYTRNRQIPLFLGYALHIIKSLTWVIGRGEKWDLYVGSNNVNAYVGILLKRLGIVKKVIYYVIDFNPRRFDKAMINRFYHWLDQYCVRYADECWNMSPRMEEGRKKYFNFSGGKQKVVPVGLWLKDARQIPFERINHHRLAFVGHIQEKQGVQYILRALPRIIKKIPTFTFLIIGGGGYLDSLKREARVLHVEKYVVFTGYVKDHAEIEELLGQSALAVALYDKYEGKNLSFSYFGNPTKIKSYLGAGLPVILSDVPYNVREIEEAGCGRIISYDPKMIADSIIEILRNEQTLRLFRENVFSYRKQFDWNRIFSLALLEII